MNKPRLVTTDGRPVDEIEQPGNDWLPWERAHLYYLPEFTGLGEAWGAALRLRIERYLHNRVVDWELKFETLEGFGGDDDEHFIDIRVGNVQLTISAWRAEFGLLGITERVDEDGEHDREAINDDNRVLATSPPKFCANLDKANIKPVYSSSLKEVRELASTLYYWFDLGFKEAVGRGYARVMARKGSPFAPFRRIHPDQWRYFKWKDVENAIAEGPRGGKLFSVYVAPGERPGFATAHAAADEAAWHPVALGYQASVSRSPDCWQAGPF